MRKDGCGPVIKQLVNAEMTQRTIVPGIIIFICRALAPGQSALPVGPRYGGGKAFRQAEFVRALTYTINFYAPRLPCRAVKKTEG